MIRQSLYRSAVLVAALMLTSCAAPPAAPVSVLSSPGDGVAVTVYNGGYCGVREIRTLQVPAGGEVSFTDVPSTIDPPTVKFKSLTDPKAKLLEQNYQYDLISCEKLLEKYLDKPVEVTLAGKTHTGNLLGNKEGVLMLRNASGIVMTPTLGILGDISKPDFIRLQSVPEGLLTHPTLLWRLATDKPGSQQCEVTYQANHIGWGADYVLTVSADEKTAGLAGWVSLENKCGKTFRDAKLKVVAGDVRRFWPEDAVRETPGGLFGGAGQAANREPMQEKPFFEYHMYTLPRPCSIANAEVKQVELFEPAEGIKIEKKLVFFPSYNWQSLTYRSQLLTETNLTNIGDTKVMVFVSFRNSKENKLGIPLPAGKVRAYKQDPQDKAMEFIGEAAIDHTPKDEDLWLQIGSSFDVVGKWRETDFKVDQEKRTMTDSIEIVLQNHKEKEDVVVRCKEPLFRWTNWKITQKSMNYLKLDSRTIAFDVPVKAGKEAVVTYTVEYNW